LVEIGFSFYRGSIIVLFPFMKSAFQPDDLMAILDTIDDAVVKFDGQARFAAMNRAAAEIYRRVGLSFFENMKGKSIWQVLPELKGTHVERELRQVIEDHAQVSFEFYYPKDQRWYETTGYPASPGAILVFRDITARKTCCTPIILHRLKLLVARRKTPLELLTKKKRRGHLMDGVEKLMVSY
jgi:PAS domain S-box-containing protein